MRSSSHCANIWTVITSTADPFSENDHMSEILLQLETHTSNPAITETLYTFRWATHNILSEYIVSKHMHPVNAGNFVTHVPSEKSEANSYAYSAHIW